MRIRNLEENDIPRVVHLWHQALKYDPISEGGFGRIILKDPNYEPEGVFVAEGREQEIVGFASAVVRRTVAGKDGGGQEYNAGFGFLKAFFTAHGSHAWDACGGLLEAAERFCTRAGKRQMMVTKYSGPYFWPGVDLRYDRLRDMLERFGYRDFDTCEDVAVDLGLPLVTELYDRARASMPADVSVLAWEPSLLPAMRAFVTEGNTPYWFPPHWEKGLSVAHDNVFILRKGTEILGWAQYSPGTPRAGFGPVLVLPRVRGSNYGARLLLECMARAREAGTERMTAGWANTGFYVRHGWSIVRRYAVFIKELPR